jgi:hypothetical protein
VSGWGDFAVVMGAATAALLGLLFVAVSIRVETIARSTELRERSAQTLTLLLTGLRSDAPRRPNLTLNEQPHGARRSFRHPQRGAGGRSEHRRRNA